MHNYQFIGVKNNTKLGVEIDNHIFIELQFKQWTFYYEKKSIIIHGINTFGLEYLVFGLCVNLNKGNDVLDLINECKDENELLQLKYYFSGRYFIFFNGIFYPDSSANLELFYNENCELISTSLGLISNLLKIKPCKQRYDEFKMLGFFPVPYTIYKGIFVLLSNEKLTWNKVEKYKRAVHQYDNKDVHIEIIDTTSYFINQLGKRFSLVLPLTGGIDSRTILAFLLKFKIKFTAYTTWYKGIRFHDLFTPVILSFFYRFNYQRIIKRKKQKYSQLKTRLVEFQNHTGFNCIDKDIVFYTYNMYPKVSSDKISVMLRGAGWAVFRGFYLNDISNLDSYTGRINGLFNLFPMLSQCSIAKSALEEWLNSQEYFTFDWRIQFYIDQRLNSWDGAIEQSINLSNFFPTMIMNSDYQLDLLLFKFINDYNGIRGRSNKLQFGIIAELNPSLNIIPYNFTKYNFFLKVINKIKRLF